MQAYYDCVSQCADNVPDPISPNLFTLIATSLPPNSPLELIYTDIASVAKRTPYTRWMLYTCWIKIAAHVGTMHTDRALIYAKVSQKLRHTYCNTDPPKRRGPKSAKELNVVAALTFAHFEAICDIYTQSTQNTTATNILRDIKTVIKNYTSPDAPDRNANVLELSTASTSMLDSYSADRALICFTQPSAGGSLFHGRLSSLCIDFLKACKSQNYQVARQSR